jgi:microcystin-dependent protein
MPALSITKTYQDGDILTEADLDNVRESIENFFNTTGIDSDNVQAGGIAASDIGINDDAYLEFGTGNDGRIGVTAANVFTVENVTSDANIEFKINDGGVVRTPLSIDAANGRAKLGRDLDANSLKIVNLAAGTDNGDAVNLAQLKEYIPVGSIQAYSAASAPTGWLLCDGSAVSRATYAALFSLIAETAGQGDNSTTFNVPDFRGRFLRGWDDGSAARDPDRGTRTAMATGGNTAENIFSVQADQIVTHSHQQHTSEPPSGPSGTCVSFTVCTSNAVLTEPTGGTETRPINAYVNYIIKY